LVCSDSSWRTRIARGLSVKRLGTAAAAATATGYRLVAAGGWRVAIGNMLVAAGRQPERTGRRAFGLAGARPV
jgi:hypothetical protein